MDQSFVAVIRTVSIQTVEVPIAAPSTKVAQQEAEHAVNALRTGSQDATLMRLHDSRGNALFEEQFISLPDGMTEVVWRGRFRTTDLEEAACLARIVMADPGSPIGSVFEARCADGRCEVIDLQRDGPLH